MKPVHLVLLFAVAASPVWADSAPDAAASAAKSLPPARGTVLEVDRQAGTVLVKHGPIASLGMDAMTMEFVVPDRRLLASLRPGDELRFQAAYRNGDYLLTQAQRVKRGTAPPAQRPSRP